MSAATLQETVNKFTKSPLLATSIDVFTIKFHVVKYGSRGSNIGVWCDTYIYGVKYAMGIIFSLWSGHVCLFDVVLDHGKNIFIHTCFDQFVDHENFGQYKVVTTGQLFN